VAATSHLRIGGAGGSGPPATMTACGDVPTHPLPRGPQHGDDRRARSSLSLAVVGRPRLAGQGDDRCVRYPAVFRCNAGFVYGTDCTVCESIAFQSGASRTKFAATSPREHRPTPQASRTPRVSQRDVMSATISRGWLAVDGASPHPRELAALQGSAPRVGISIEHERSVPDDRSETRLRGLVARIRLPMSIRSRSPVWRWATRVVGALVALAVAAFCPSEPTSHGASTRPRIA
jgi:hypothetical protein